jgi:hypothetical protein
MTFNIMTFSKSTQTINTQHNHIKVIAYSESCIPEWHLCSVSIVLSDIMLGIVMLSAIHVGYHE